MKWIHFGIATFFWSGRIPFAPGTWGTLAALPILIPVMPLCSPLIHGAILLVLTALSTYSVEWCQRQEQMHDPGWIVIDEVLGIYLAAILVSPRTATQWIIITILFRAFDIVKIWPASWADKKITHGFGTILDDLISGVYAAMAYFVVLKFFETT